MPPLYVVATPIGNLRDLTARAREVLAACDAIVAEDTRRTRQLLTHFGISVRCLERVDARRKPSISDLPVELATQD